MPVGHLIKDVAPEVADLTNILTAEWRAGKSGTPYPRGVSAPVLIEDEQPLRFGRGSSPVRLYVIWDAWGDLTQQQRSEIVMNAYEATHDVPDILRITLAMGLTPSEARRMGLKYTT